MDIPSSNTLDEIASCKVKQTRPINYPRKRPVAAIFVPSLDIRANVWLTA
jgi:hypothetical protein